MAPKRATFLCYGEDAMCAETCKFIEDAGVILEKRDIGKNPLSEDELDTLVGTLNISHFINSLSEAYSKTGWDKTPPNRQEIIEAMAKDYTLIRRPIVMVSRLVTIGADKKRIGEMLQLNRQNDMPDPARPPLRSGHKKGQRVGSSRSPR
jgi:arsenate reductase-like glutaredoxin family protein